MIAWLRENPSPTNELYGANLRDLHKIYGGLGGFEGVLTELEDCPAGSRAATIDEVERRYMVRNLKLMIPEFVRCAKDMPRSIRYSPVPTFSQTM